MRRRTEIAGRIRADRAIAIVRTSGACAVGIGSALTRGDLDTVSRRTAALLAAID